MRLRLVCACVRVDVGVAVVEAAAVVDGRRAGGGVVAIGFAALAVAVLGASAISAISGVACGAMAVIVGGSIVPSIGSGWTSS